MAAPAQPKSSERTSKEDLKEPSEEAPRYERAIGEWSAMSAHGHAGQRV